MSGASIVILHLKIELVAWYREYAALWSLNKKQYVIISVVFFLSALSLFLVDVNKVLF